MTDLVCLVADKAIEAMLDAVLHRHESLGVRSFSFDIFVHPGRDPGCFRHSPAFLVGRRGAYAHALVVFDRAWEGAPTQDAPALEHDLRHRLAALGEGWADVVVIEPEVDVWIWSRSPNVDAVLGWKHRKPALRSWLESAGLLAAGAAKPRDPKEAVERALAEVDLRRSSSLYRKVAQQVSLPACDDPSFGRLRSILVGWFPPPAA
ncbi:MAG: hypothetical protein QME96_02950 [Myxococcota bacterium]|nr:hypothetical protein [Myxococcota bacterium]